MPEKDSAAWLEVCEECSRYSKTFDLRKYPEQVEFLPFVPQENKGMEALAFLNMDAEIHTETESLAFLNFYLANYEGMQVDGAGFLQGRLHLQQGELLDDTDVKVTARKLSLHLFDLHVEGDGNIRIKTVDQEESTDVSVTFINLDAFAGNITNCHAVLIVAERKSIIEITTDLLYRGHFSNDIEFRF